MLIRTHPRSLKSNALRVLRLLKNWKAVNVERLELLRTLPFPSRFRTLFRETCQFLEQSQWWSEEQLIQYQSTQLRRLLIHCLHNVPYYRRLFTTLGFDANAVKSIEDLRALPFLTRELVEQNLGDLQAENFPANQLEYFATGGSTGIPMKFYLDRYYTNTVRDAFFARMWGWVGYAPYQPGVVLRGSVVDSSNARAYFDYDVLENKLILSSYHLRAAVLPRFYELLVAFRPVTIQAYPSALTPLARFMLDERCEPVETLKLILCGSENLYEWQRSLIEQAFQRRVYSWYGHSENVLLAGECEYSKEYHQFSEHGVLDLVRKDGSIITSPGEIGEIVGTGFINNAMPFVRYKTGDLATYASGKCSCGRNYGRLQGIEGRLQELIVTSDGRYISMTAINMHSDLFDRVQQFQFVQRERGKIVMNIVKKPTYSQNDSERIILELKKKIGSGMEIELAFVDAIPLTQRGKHRFLVQHFPIQYSD